MLGGLWSWISPDITRDWKEGYIQQIDHVVASRQTKPTGFDVIS